MSPEEDSHAEDDLTPDRAFSLAPSEQPEPQFVTDNMARYFEKQSQEIAPKTFRSLVGGEEDFVG